MRQQSTEEYRLSLRQLKEQKKGNSPALTIDDNNDNREEESHEQHQLSLYIQSEQILTKYAWAATHNTTVVWCDRTLQNKTVSTDQEQQVQ